MPRAKKLNNSSYQDLANNVLAIRSAFSQKVQDESLFPKNDPVFKSVIGSIVTELTRASSSLVRLQRILEYLEVSGGYHYALDSNGEIRKMSTEDILRRIKVRSVMTAEEEYLG